MQQFESRATYLGTPPRYSSRQTYDLQCHKAPVRNANKASGRIQNNNKSTQYNIIILRIM